MNGLSRWYRINPRPGKMVRANFEADTWNLEGHSEREFELGTPIEGWKGEGWFAASCPEMEGPLEDVLRTANLLPAFSQRLKATLEENQITGLQYLPVAVLDSERKIIADYFLANLLYTLPALDEEKSVIRKDRLVERDGTIKEWIGAIPKLVLRGSVLQDYDMIRLHAFSSALFVSANFKRLFERSGFTGWGFWPVQVSSG